MTRDEKLLKRALDVLDWAHDVFGLEKDGIAIKTALRDRLAQPEQCRYPDCKCATDNPCLKGLAQPEQEPVACIGTNGELMWLNKPRVIYSKPQPLFTTPPQRTWVGSGDLEDSNAYLTPPQPEPVVYEDLATELFVIAQTSPADDGFADTIERIESWLRDHFSTPPQRKPLTDEEIAAGRRAPWGRGLSLDAFKAGVRFAEASYGIKGKA